MDIIFGICLVMIVAIICWATNGPFCPKHIFTRMKRGETIRITDKTDLLRLKEQEDGGVTNEVEWICPKCGKIVTKREIVTE